MEVSITEDGPSAQRVGGNTYRRGEVYDVDEATAELLLSQDHFEESSDDDSEEELQEDEDSEPDAVTSDEVTFEFDEDEWLEPDYEERLALVESGEADEHLDEIAEIERSQQVLDAVEDRQ